MKTNTYDAYDKEFGKKMSEIAREVNKKREDIEAAARRLKAEEAIPAILDRIEEEAKKGEFDLVYRVKPDIDSKYLCVLLRENYGLGIWEASSGTDGDFKIDWNNNRGQ